MINRKEQDKTAKEEQERKLNEFQDWLMSGIIDPQRASEIIELYYEENPFQVKKMKIYIDIETIPTQNKEHQDFVCENLKPPANYKNEETINKWLEENKELAVNKTSLDGAFGEVVVISAANNDDEVVTFYRKDWQVKDREKDILTRFNNWLKEQANRCKTVPVFIGHNVTSFDGLFLWQRCIINGVKPYYKMDKRNTYDTMWEWCGYNRESKPSLNKLCQVLNIEQKGDIDGSKVWQAVQDGRIDEVAEYCAKDVERVRAIYKRMNFEVQK